MKKTAIRTANLQKMTADTMHGIARLHDRRPDDFKVLVRAVETRLDESGLPALSARFDDLDDPAVVVTLGELTGPLARELMQDNDVRSALGRLAVEYAQLPATDEIRLRTSKDTHSIDKAVWAGLIIGGIVVGVAILALAVKDMDKPKKPDEDETYAP